MKKRKIVVTGANGMLARDLIPFLEEKYEVYSFARNNLDISNKKEVESALFGIRPHVVVNCAAFTKVDECETNPDCYSVNAGGVYHLAHTCKKTKTKLVHFSTDYVFDGTADRFYREDDGMNPINHYGRSKMLGELAVREASDSLTLRVQWLFGVHGPNFVKTILKISETKDVLKVVNDQFGRPTSTAFLSKAVYYLIKENASGTFHLGPTDHCSWYDFAKEIVRRMRKGVEVLPCSSEEYPRPAMRPKNSVLDIAHALYNNVPCYSWHEHLSGYLNA